MRIVVRWSVPLLAILSAGCDVEPPRAGCTPGLSVPCACTNGESGRQLCMQTREFGVCTCESADAGDSPSVDGGHDPRDAGQPSGATIGPGGGLVTGPSIRLTFPPGALPTETYISIAVDTSTPAGTWGTRDIVYALEPAGLALLRPLTVHLDEPSAGARASVFIERKGQAGFVSLGGRFSGQTLETQASYLAPLFSADAIDSADLVDPSCLKTRVARTAVAPPSAVSLAVRVRDCVDRPWIDIPPGALRVRESDHTEAVSVRRDASLLHVFATVLVELGDDVLGSLPARANGVRQAVEELELGEDRLHVGLTAFAGEDSATILVRPSLDRSLLTAELGRLVAERGTYPGRVGTGTNLLGSLRAAIANNERERIAFEARQSGGALTAGVILIVTAGYDDTSPDPVLDMLEVRRDITQSATEVAIVALPSGLLDKDLLHTIAGEDVFVSPTSATYERDFRAAAKLLRRRAEATHLLTYCSRSRGGAGTAAVEGSGQGVVTTAVAGSFSAQGFGEGCDAQAAVTECGGSDCAGALCGACNDRRESCEPVARACLDDCTLQGLCEGQAFTNQSGYSVVCEPTPRWASCLGTCSDATADPRFDFCGGACIDVNEDDANCGHCGNACGVNTTCAGASCIVRWLPTQVPPDAVSADDYIVTPETAEDSATGLVWQRTADSVTRSWREAKQHCETLDFAGATNWRLPSRIELATIIDYGRVAPALDEVVFPNQASDAYWSSSPVDNDRAWSVGFAQGTVRSQAIADRFLSRCVRTR